MTGVTDDAGIRDTSPVQCTIKRPVCRRGLHTDAAPVKQTSHQDNAFYFYKCNRQDNIGLEMDLYLCDRSLS